MKIVLVHNRYQRPGGEDRVFEAEGELLRRNGHEVTEYAAHNDDVASLGLVALAGKTIWNRDTTRGMREIFQRVRPDVVHVHNTLPLVSPAVYYAARAGGVPVVQTLHNYRLLCPGGLLQRGGHVCESCVGRAVAWPAVVHGCYRHSRAATSVVAAMLAMHGGGGTWQRYVDVYIALTEFARAKFIEGGLPREKVVVKPNFVCREPVARGGDGEYALFAGRLSPEKGVRTLLAAWRSVAGLPLKVAGDGPLRDELAGYVETEGLAGRVELLGWRTGEEVLELMRGARLLVLPSEWFETFGLVAIEAFACGVPVVASRIGGPEELIDDGVTGLHFSPGDVEELAARVNWAIAHPELLRGMGAAARRAYEAKYTAERNLVSLMAIYELARASRKRKAARCNAAGVSGVLV